ncbi:unnamed protein product [Microthlaspi erraticum]|uniref:Pentatricopeptide repeat-containing protein n=1 Tax=Microthlaspi erraticum TaxID=1685480 RepID=A0A6D2L0C1_9BRAS|nr:unnamed protein product [Microthlaspi erraticum]
MEAEKLEADVVIYNTVIDGLCKYSIRMMHSSYSMKWRTKSKRVEDGMELFREMSQRGLVGDTVTYNTLIQGFFQAGDCEMPNKFSTDGFWCAS